VRSRCRLTFKLTGTGAGERGLHGVRFFLPRRRVKGNVPVSGPVSAWVVPGSCPPFALRFPIALQLVTRRYPGDLAVPLGRWVRPFSPALFVPPMRAGMGPRGPFPSAEALTLRRPRNGLAHDASLHRGATRWDWWSAACRRPLEAFQRAAVWPTGPVGACRGAGTRNRVQARGVAHPHGEQGNPPPNSTCLPRGIPSPLSNNCRYGVREGLQPCG